MNAPDKVRKAESDTGLRRLNNFLHEPASGPHGHHFAELRRPIRQELPRGRFVSTGGL